jgi:two-component system sensor histidine kinase VanS
MNPQPGPRVRIRTRLTALYAGTFVVVGAGLLTLVFVMVSAFAAAPTVVAPAIEADGRCAVPQVSPSSPMSAFAVPLLIALGVCAVAAVLVGWLVAGRMLAPISRITATAAGIAAGSLHDRVALDGPDDEIRELSATFDAMLTRLEAAFEAQRRFTANASHELLTPLATSRAVLEVAAADPADTDVPELTGTLLAINTRSEELVDALLDLARAENGRVTRTPVDCADVAWCALDEVAAEADRRAVAVRADVSPAVVAGDDALLAQLVGNLVRNAVRHNGPGGQVCVRVGEDGGSAVVTVTNTGPVVPADLAGTLFEPFVRVQARTQGAGHGLGLAVVRAVALAHGGTVSATANPAGGLTVEVRLPSAAATPTPVP